MYTLLPAMKGANGQLLLQSIDDMEERYTGLHLTHHLVRFRTILRRSTTMAVQDKQIVEARLHMYDILLDQDPQIQERIARGEIRGQQKAVADFVEDRFRALVEIAQQQATGVN